MIKNENRILKIIKFAPTIFILTLCIIINFYLFYEKKNTLETEKQQIKQRYINTNKELVRNEVQEILHYIKIKQKNTEIELKTVLKKRVLNAHQIALNVYNLNKHKSKEEIIKSIKSVLKGIKYGNDGYFFIYDLNGINIFHGNNKKLEGKNLLNYKDSKGNEISKDLNTIFKTKKRLFIHGIGPNKIQKSIKNRIF